MNCDEAFDQLTDPKHRDSADLRWHLERCPRCRQMQDVLAPALDLFDAPGEMFMESPSLPPSGSGFLSAESILLAERTAAELSRSHVAEPPRRKSFVMASLKYAAFFFLGAAVVFGITNFSADGKPAISAQPTQCLWQQQQQGSNSERSANSKSVVLSCVECHLSSTGP